MARTVWLTLAAAVLSLPPQISEGHHSTAEFDYSKTVVLHGKVKELQWMNPHSYVQLLVVTEGATGEWAIEIGAPLFNMRMGWKPTSVKAGEEVTMIIMPA